MLKDDPNYRRVNVRARSPLGNSSYWLAADHLLVVEVSGTVERYRRFELRDIQAAVVVPARTRRVGNLVFVGLLVPVLGFGTLGLIEELKNNFGDPMGVFLLIAIACVALLLAAALILNSVRGPGGRLLLKTAVQTFAVPGIGRRIHAERLLNELTTAIRGVQFAAASASAAADAPVDGAVSAAPGVPEAAP